VGQGWAVDGAASTNLAARLQYCEGHSNGPHAYVSLRGALGDPQHPLNYLAIPPAMFQSVAQGLGASGCARNARIVVEKPFGRDLSSARALNATLHQVFDEKSIFRIDHYLGKESVQNLL